jgi:hypothetical protein
MLTWGRDIGARGIRGIGDAAPESKDWAISSGTRGSLLELALAQDYASQAGGAWSLLASRHDFVKSLLLRSGGTQSLPNEGRKSRMSYESRPNLGL